MALTFGDYLHGKQDPFTFRAVADEIDDQEGFARYLKACGEAFVSVSTQIKDKIQALTKRFIDNRRGEGHYPSVAGLENGYDLGYVLAGTKTISDNAYSVYLGCYEMSNNILKKQKLNGLRELVEKVGWLITGPQRMYKHLDEVIQKVRAGKGSSDYVITRTEVLETLDDELMERIHWLEQTASHVNDAIKAYLGQMNQKMPPKLRPKRR